MTFESLKQTLRTFSSGEWIMVAIVVVAFTAAMDTIGFVIGLVVGYIVVMAYRRDQQKRLAREATEETPPTP